MEGKKLKELLVEWLKLLTSAKIKTLSLIKISKSYVKVILEFNLEKILKLY